MKPLFALAACALSALTQAKAHGGNPRFDVAPARGIDFVHSCGSKDKDWILEVNGSGVALLDADSDGDLDIYFVNGSLFDLAPDAPRPRNRLYRNDGDWKFSDMTDSAGVGDAGWGSAASVADVDNDGHLDLYVTNFGPNALYFGRGDGTFERLRRGVEDPGWSTSASWADFDRDGRLDVYVVNYLDFAQRPEKKRGSTSCTYKAQAIFCGPGGWPAAQDRLYRGLPNGHFEDVTERWGVLAAGPSFGLGSLVVDVQNDGFPDVIVANDTQKNFCFANISGNTLREAGLYYGIAYNDYGVGQGSMGLTSGIVHDGRLAVFTTNFEDDTNTLYELDDGLFTEATTRAGLAHASYRYLGWGTFFFDPDGDGDLDLFVANGHVAPQADAMPSSLGYAQRNQLFVNDGDGAYTESRAVGAGLELVRSSRGAAFGDLDGDGDEDIVVSNVDGSPDLLENVSRQAARVSVRLRGTRSNRAAIGARVIIETNETPPRRQERTVQSGMSFASQCELTIRFGFGATAPALARLLVVWPSGITETFPPPSVGKTIDIVEGTGQRPR